MRKLTVIVVSIALALAASPLFAHGGHTSCKGGMAGLAAAAGFPTGPNGKGIDGKNFVSVAARNGEVAAGIAFIHELCERN